MRRLSRSLHFALLGVALAVPAAAQSGTATFSGSLSDTIGRPLPNVTVRLKSGAGAALEARTDLQGSFSFLRVPAGEYDVSASVPGFVARYHVTLGAGQTVRRDVPLQIGEVQETVTVTSGAEPPAVRSAPAIDAAEWIGSDRCRDSAAAGCLDPPRKIRDVRPRHPNTGDLSAVVRIDAVIGVDGLVKAVRLTAPVAAAYANAAIEAVSKWQFTPTRLDGVPVETIMHVAVNFRPQ